MSEQLPYDEQWDNLPLPDSEASWEKMEVLLDEDKKRRRLLPFWFWRYAALALILVSGFVGGWFLMRQEDNKVEAKVKIEDKDKAKIEVDEKKNAEIENKSKVETIDNKERDGKDIVENENSISTKNVTTSTDKQIENIKKNKAIQEKIVTGKQIVATNRTKSKIVLDNAVNNKLIKIKKTPAIVIKDSKEDQDNKVPTQEPVLSETKTKQNIVAKDSSMLIVEKVKDSTAINDTTIVSPVTEENKKKAEQKKKPAFVWSAGVGLQQGIALNGQQSSAYNYYGKHNSASDYIPSIYLRLQKGKWYLQAEGNYSVPQPVKSFSFSQATKYEATNFMLTTERFFIEKIYYHQLPLSINYSIVPSWSVGAGGMYNILAGAVTTKETKSKNVLSGVETIDKMLAPVKGYKDSFLYKTTAGILLHTDYHWKRFSLGLRYTKNLQPFIKYTTPNGEIMDEKNGAMQAILRFRLWRNSK